MKVKVNKLENRRDTHKKDLCKGRYKYVYKNNCKPETKLEIMTMVVGLPDIKIIFTGRRHIYFWELPDTDWCGEVTKATIFKFIGVDQIDKNSLSR
jgi:hypothetical protein